MGFQHKMFNGRGINHPVKNLISGKGEITSQNHGFAVNKDELEANSDLEITHVHLNDGTVAGMRMKYKNCFLYSITRKLVLDLMIHLIYSISLFKI
jgi:carbamoylphosphate synthase small subunit